MLISVWLSEFRVYKLVTARSAIIKDVPTQQRIAGRKRTSETGGVRI